MGFLNLFRRNTFEHGVHPVDHKALTNQLPIRRMPFAPRLMIPLSQHRGAPAKPLVKPGEEVVRGQLIAEAQGFVSVPMHAPATGRVKAIDLITTAEGPKTEAIIIDVYEGASQEVLYEAEQDVSTMEAADIVSAVKDLGLVGHFAFEAPEASQVAEKKDHIVPLPGL